MKDSYLKVSTSLALFYFLFYATFATFLPYLPLYLKENGIDEVQIGLLMAIGPLVMLVAQPLWGFIGDLFCGHIKILRYNLLLCAFITLGFVITKEFYWLLLVMSIYVFFQSPITPLADSIVLGFQNKGVLHFGRIRLWGSLGFALIAGLVGVLLEYTSASNLFYACSAFYVASLFATMGLPAPEPTKTKLDWSLFKPLIRNTKFISFIVLVMLIHAAFVSFNTFFSTYFIEQGGGKTTLGLAWLLAAVSEIPLFYWSHKLIKRFSPLKLLITASLLYGFRWLLVASAASWQQLVFLQLSQSVTFGLFYFSAVSYVISVVPKRLLSTGQGILAAFGLGLGSILGNTFGGIMVKTHGASGLFLFNGFLCIGSVVIFTLFLGLPKLMLAYKKY